MNNLVSSFRYRPEIDGLRAIAVGLVVLYHGGFGFSGGFIGVDVFFVISGFLITSLIWKDLEAGKFSMLHFWERRARRIIPAASVAVLLTLAAGAFFLLPADFTSLGRATLSQALFAANIHYWRDSGYFATVAEEKPLLHTWSLAVEEQYYLVVPFAIWFLYRFGFFRTRPGVLTVLGTGFLISLALSIVGVVKGPNATFYLLPTRAWELALGGLIVFIPHAKWTRIVGVREVLSVLGLGLIFACSLTYNSRTPFPGMAAIGPCLGAALIIWANQHDGEGRLTWSGKLLSLKPVVFVGLISYSLYLWHWPFFAYARYNSVDHLPLATRLALTAAGSLFAVLSWKFVETPFRKGTLGPGKKIFPWALSGLGAMILGGGAVIAMKGVPDRFPVQAQVYAAAQHNMGFVSENSIEDVKSDKLKRFGAKGQTPTGLLWGDSHAMAAQPAFDHVFQQLGRTAVVATHSATAPLLDWFYTSRTGMNDQAPEFSAAVLEYVRNKRLQVVVLAANWRNMADEPSFDPVTFQKATVETVRSLRQAGADVWIFLSVPVHEFDVPKVLSRSVLQGFDPSKYASAVTSVKQYDTFSEETVAEVKRLGVRFLDPKPAFMKNGSDKFQLGSESISFYRDSHHLSVEAAREMLGPYLHRLVRE